MTYIEDVLSEGLYPPGFGGSVEPGWSTLSALTGRKAGEVAVVRVGRSEIPAAFTLTIRRDDEPTWSLELLFVVEDESTLALRAAFAFGEELDQALDRVTRVRPLARWKQSAIVAWTFDSSEQAAEKLEKALGDQAATAYLYKKLLATEDVSTTRRRNRVTPTLLKEVAKIYREAWDDSQNPTAAVAMHFHTSPSTAARWVGMARKAKELGPTLKGRGGEGA